MGRGTKNVSGCPASGKALGVTAAVYAAKRKFTDKHIDARKVLNWN